MLPTPVYLPGKFRGQRSLLGCSLWGHKKSDMTEYTQLLYLSKKPTKALNEKQEQTN